MQELSYMNKGKTESESLKTAYNSGLVKYFIAPVLYKNMKLQIFKHLIKQGQKKDPL